MPRAENFHSRHFLSKYRLWIYTKTFFVYPKPLCLSAGVNDLQDQLVNGIRIAPLTNQFIALFVEQVDQDAAFYIIKFDFYFLHNGTSKVY